MWNSVRLFGRNLLQSHRGHYACGLCPNDAGESQSSWVLLYLLVALTGCKKRLEYRAKAHDVEKAARHKALENHHHSILRKTAGEVCDWSKWCDSCPGYPAGHIATHLPPVLITENYINKEIELGAASMHTIMWFSMNKIEFIDKKN